MDITAFQDLRGVRVTPILRRAWNALTPNNWPGWALSIIAGVLLSIGAFYVYYADRDGVALPVENFGIDGSLYGGLFLAVGGMAFAEAFIHQRPSIGVVGALGSFVVLHALTVATGVTVLPNSLLAFVYLMAVFSMMVVMLAMAHEAELLRAAERKATVDQVMNIDDIDIQFERELANV